MLKTALLVVVLLAAGGAAAVSVEGSSPVPLGKKKVSAYVVKCGAPLRFGVSGPGSLSLDVRAQADALDKPMQADFTRGDRFVSKNSLAFKKSKDAGKPYAGIAQIVLPVPDGAQQYALACDASSEIAVSFQMSKKAGKKNLAAAEVEVPKAAPPPNVQATGGDAGAAPPGAPETSAASGDAYYGLFQPTVF